MHYANAYDGHGSRCGELKDLERHSNPHPPVSGYKEVAEKFGLEIKKTSIAAANEVNLDNEAITNWVRDTTKDKKWGAEKLGEEINRVIQKAEA